MKLLTLLLPLLTHAAHAGDAPSVHGMLFFGKSQAYVSHLPMFHSPHDYQLIAEIEVPEPAQRAYAKAQQEHPEETVYTLVPERFSLPQMVAEPKPFRADLYLGHFERGGTPIAEGITVKFSKVLHFQKLDPLGARPKSASYLLFGSLNEAYLAHLISARPDFDQILEAEAFTAPFSAMKIQFPSSMENSKPMEPACYAVQKVGTQSFFRLNVKRSLYLEHGDLAH